MVVSPCRTVTRAALSVPATQSVCAWRKQRGFHGNFPTIQQLRVPRSLGVKYGTRCAQSHRHRHRQQPPSESYDLISDDVILKVLVLRPWIGKRNEEQSFGGRPPVDGYGIRGRLNWIEAPVRETVCMQGASSVS